MSLPIGAKYIDNIDFTQLNFLTATGVTGTISSNDYDLTTGKPKNNLYLNSKVDAFFIDTLKNNLYENKNVNDSFIYKYPRVLETESTRDMQVTNETTIDAIFIHEGASMQNMFGYYIYTLDNEGNKKLLANDTDPQGYYYNPTVIFPYVYSESGDSTTIQQGNTRRLKGNLPNGNFENIYIGMFLVPHGWYAFKQNGPVANKDILYSTIDFNQKHKDSEFGMINDKIYSVYFKAKSDQDHELLSVGFEDIIVTGT